ncbi:MAG: prolyl oligopeptidase family serine peptidase [Edaphobacter sp.]|uniref:S9 family peptidase n=1 Tax=Edaphobacter sp. TaxID=1934404 RepID=UPI00239113DA|nr:prolyl oligopeptidase family serine peptidase [Edaphobacter sp.]MDE1176443.1 prolyl oligopeptidase family serine peptidase [Edaphobacter sp.]
MTHRRTLCLLSLFCLGTSPLWGQNFTIEQALSAPFASDLVAGPKPDTAAWMEDQQGHRNLYTAESDTKGHFQVRKLTAYDSDDGQEMYDIAWTPDGASLVFVRGGDSEYPEKSDPNPTHRSTGVSRDVLIVPASGGTPRKLGEGFSPAVSPKGDQVTFLAHGSVYAADLQPEGAKAHQMFIARGDITALTWSPDGHALAFVSDRGDHGFIGVYDVATGRIQYLSPSTADDADPVWSSDSRRIAFIRVPGLPEGSSFARRTAPPWSICVADASTGEGRAIWTADEGPGSSFREIHGTELLWSKDDRLIFPWEKEGWSHLYSVPAEGGKAELLTPGEFEVEDMQLTQDGHSILYASNQSDIDRRHLWSVSTAGGKPQQLTSGNTIDVAPVDTSHSIIYLRSDAHTPLRPAALLSHGATTDLTPQLIPSTFPGKQFIAPEQVLLPAADGLPLHGQIFLPPNAHDGKKHPALVFFHGGSRRQMLLGFHTMGYYSNAYAMNQYLASRGYIVLSVNYRSGIGYGLNFREALHYGRDGAAEYNDILGAGHYLQSRSDVDTHRIGVWGGSYGGFMTALALARASDIFSAGVDMHGVHQWLPPSDAKPSHDPEANAKTRKVAWESSPMAYLSTWRSPVLLIQGDDDRNVPFSQTVNLSRELTKLHIEHEELVFPDEIHGFLLHRSWIAAYEAEADFFRRHLLQQPDKESH